MSARPAFALALALALAFIMTTFDVQDMTCGHCAATITRTLQALDPAAQVQIDLAAKSVVVESARISAEQGRAALEEAGYTAVPR